MVAKGLIQDILMRKDNDTFNIGAYKFNEETVIISDDIQILHNQEALWQGIVGVLHTPIGVVDGVGMENYGSKILELRGQKVDYHTAELAKLYIQQTKSQFQGYVNDFSKIIVKVPKDENSRYTMRIDIEVDSVFGFFDRQFYI